MNPAIPLSAIETLSRIDQSSGDRGEEDKKEVKGEKGGKSEKKQTPFCTASSFHPSRWSRMSRSPKRVPMPPPLLLHVPLVSYRNVHSAGTKVI
jgi:hypothetical protein